MCLLAPHLRPDNAADLIAAGTHLTKAQIEVMLAERFPRPDLATLVQPVNDASAVSCQHAPGHVGMTTPEHAQVPAVAASPLRFTSAPTVPTAAKLSSLAPERFAIQVTVSGSTHDKLRYAQELLGHTVPSGDVAQVLDRALDALIVQLERQRFAASARPRARRGTPKGRHVPADVRRQVWQRDGGRCTFVSDKGHRCEARTRLEFDHATPVARGGSATVDGMRLRCRAHNQFEAERVFGEGFMKRKREAAKACAAEVRERKRATGLPAPESDVTPWLRVLGARPDEIRAAIARCGAIPGAPLEQRVKHALMGMGPRGVRRPLPVMSGPA